MGAARAFGKASEDRMKATADRHAAMAGTRRSSGLAETIGGGTANSPFGMSPEEREFAKWNPGTAEAAMHSRATMQEGEKNRSLQRDIDPGATDARTPAIPGRCTTGRCSSSTGTLERCTNSEATAMPV